MGAPRRTWVVLSIAAAVILADQVSKAIVRANLVDRPPLDLIPGVLRLSYVTNTGGAFGFSQSTPWFFAAASILVSIWIVVRAIRGVGSTAVAIGMGLILGGAVGNVIDRAAGGLGMTGEVTDFIDFRVWPVFNLADSAVVIGAVVLAFALAGGSHERAS